MTTTQRATLLTDLYALRAQTGAVFVRANQEHKLIAAVDLAMARDCISEAITKIETTSNASQDPSPA